MQFMSTRNMKYVFSLYTSKGQIKIPGPYLGKMTPVAKH